jgi:hypothetical protein
VASRGRDRFDPRRPSSITPLERSSIRHNDGCIRTAPARIVHARTVRPEAAAAAAAADPVPAATAIGHADLSRRALLPSACGRGRAGRRATAGGAAPDTLLPRQTRRGLVIAQAATRNPSYFIPHAHAHMHATYTHTRAAGRRWKLPLSRE